MTDLERDCLSSLMKAATDVHAAVAAGLEAEHFSTPEGARLFRAVQRAAADLKETGPDAIWLKLSEEDGPKPRPIDLAVIDNLQPTSAFASELVRRLIDSARVRRLRHGLKRAAAAAEEQSDDFDAVWQGVAPHLEAAQSVTVSSRSRSLEEMAQSVIDQIENPVKQKLVRTGWQGWDKLATPLKAGEMVTIAARPGLGKTAFALQLAVKVADSSETVVFFSLEMTGEELVDRVAKHRMGRSCAANSPEYLAAVRQVGKLKNLVVYDNTDRHTMDSIEARSRLHANTSQGLGLIVIDYIQLIEPSDRRVNREQQVAEISRRCKQLAGMLHCPVLVLAQLNREIEKDDRRPRLSDLRESGAIEQDSDRVWFLWQDPAKIIPGSENASSVEALLIQAKCRGGPPNVGSRMMFNRPAFTFNQLFSHADN